MKANVTMIRKQRRYSEEFKRQVVQDFESEKYSVVQLEKLHGIHNQRIYNWVYKYSKRPPRGLTKKAIALWNIKLAAVKK